MRIGYKTVIMKLDEMITQKWKKYEMMTINCVQPGVPLGVRDDYKEESVHNCKLVAY